jgi:hypothetical protein
LSPPALSIRCQNVRSIPAARDTPAVASGVRVDPNGLSYLFVGIVGVLRRGYAACMPLACATYRPRDAERGVLYGIVDAVQGVRVRAARAVLL